MNPLEERIYIFIVDYLSNISSIPYQDKKSILQYRYLDVGHIDSFGIINFIITLEDKFGISLTAQDTESDEFRSIAGLIKTITKKLEKR
ncbi:MAG: hypothetical protein AB1629_02430 [Candidatus Omnitrophota bacterium]